MEGTNDGAATREAQMERTSGMAKGLRAVATVVFLAAALISTGCSDNALLNPVNESAQGDTIANPAGHDAEPAGHDTEP